MCVSCALLMARGMGGAAYHDGVCVGVMCCWCCSGVSDDAVDAVVVVELMEVSWWCFDDSLQRACE